MRIKNFAEHKQRAGENRNNKYTPAVTKVEEWTNLDTGVGAAMAAGSQAEKGICALLVQAAIIIRSSKDNKKLWPLKAIGMKFHLAFLDMIAMAKRIKTSPTRFLKAVTIPAL